ncbi:hypothetical protein K8W59_14085 [Nocardioides rotundus]|uniref:hypothetical protein n=1 Tax=Nocardioides rotundus TaxID=1774216 RepID=UPI001CBAEE4C|nr:hypothetical protein [Nocardioides rotundus]UAL28934.1 hypothetical protein K8W59_14085 [Nocardioides rotundus]
MTDRLATLLHDEADRLDVPAPPAADILRGGRRIRRRRRLAAGGAALALAAVAGTGAAVLLDREPASQVAAEPTGPDYRTVYAAGSTVVVDGARATVPGAVHDMLYTSAGVLVRSNQNGGSSDGSGTETLTLVGPDGQATPLGTMPEGVGPATDPDQAVYALAEPDGEGFVAVVRDVRTREVVARVPLPDLPMSYWDVPPLSLSGDTLYAGYKSSTWAVDWPTGEGGREVPAIGGGLQEISAGRVVDGSEGKARVVDLATGAEVLSVDTGPDAWSQLSPDGTRLLVTVYGRSESVTTLYDVESGRSRELPTPAMRNGMGFGWRWASDGRAVTRDGDQLLTCGLDACDRTPTADGLSGDLRYGGGRLES